MDENQKPKLVDSEPTEKPSSSKSSSNWALFGSPYLILGLTFLIIGISSPVFFIIGFTFIALSFSMSFEGYDSNGKKIPVEPETDTAAEPEAEVPSATEAPSKSETPGETGPRL